LFKPIEGKIDELVRMVEQYASFLVKRRKADDDEDPPTILD
jgi:hypothetical protein